MLSFAIITSLVTLMQKCPNSCKPCYAWWSIWRETGGTNKHVHSKFNKVPNPRCICVTYYHLMDFERQLGISRHMDDKEYHQRLASPYFTTDTKVL